MTSQKMRIVRVGNGVAYANNDESIDNLTAFSFGKIKNYRGETAKELKFLQGQEVVVNYDEIKHEVSSVVTPL